MNRTISYLLISLFVLAISFHLKATKPIYFYLKSVTIKGETNFNCFYFRYNQNNHENKLISGQNDNTEKISFRIPVKSFNGKNPIMTKDFIQMLKVKTYPKIEVKIKKSHLIKISKGSGDNNLVLNMSLAGENRKVWGTYETQPYSKNKILVKVQTKIQLENFNLGPPKKMLGIIQVKDLILIKFDVIASSIKFSEN